VIFFKYLQNICRKIWPLFCAVWSVAYLNEITLRRGIFISEKKERKLSVPGGKAGLFPEDAYTSKE